MFYTREGLKLCSIKYFGRSNSLHFPFSAVSFHCRSNVPAGQPHVLCLNSHCATREGTFGPNSHYHIFFHSNKAKNANRERLLAFSAPSYWSWFGFAIILDDIPEADLHQCCSSWVRYILYGRKKKSCAVKKDINSVSTPSPSGWKQAKLNVEHHYNI